MISGVGRAMLLKSLGRSFLLALKVLRGELKGIIFSRGLGWFETNGKFNFSRELTKTWQEAKYFALIVKTSWEDCSSNSFCLFTVLCRP